MGGSLSRGEVQTVTIVITGPTPKARWNRFTRDMDEILNKYRTLNVRLKSIVNEPTARRKRRSRR